MFVQDASTSDFWDSEKILKMIRKIIEKFIEKYKNLMRFLYLCEIIWSETVTPAVNLDLGIESSR